MQPRLLGPGEGCAVRAPGSANVLAPQRAALAVRWRRGVGRPDPVKETRITLRLIMVSVEVPLVPQRRVYELACFLTQKQRKALLRLLELRRPLQ